MNAINFDDPSIDWERELPPHIVAQQRQEAARQEAAMGVRRPMRSVHGGVAIEIYTPDRPRPAPAPSSSSHSPALGGGGGGGAYSSRGGHSSPSSPYGTPARALAAGMYGGTPPPSHRLRPPGGVGAGAVTPPRPLPQQPLVTARDAGNSQREFLRMRADRAHNDFHSAAPPPAVAASHAYRGAHPQAEAVAARRAAEVAAQNEQQRLRMAQRAEANEAHREAVRSGHERALRLQEEAVRARMLERSAIPHSSHPHHGHGQQLQQQQSPAEGRELRELRAVQQRLEAEERAMLSEAMRGGASAAAMRAPTEGLPPPRQQVVSLPPGSLPQPQRSPPPSAQSLHGGGPRTPPPAANTPRTPPPPFAPYAEDEGSLQRIQRVADDITFGAGGQRQLEARGMRGLRTQRRHPNAAQHYGEARGVDIFGAPLPVRPVGIGAAGAGASASQGQGAEGDGGWELADFSYEALLELGSMAVPTGLSKKQLERYRPTILTPEAVAALAKEGHADCPICLEEFEAGERSLAIQCRHAFHYQCIVQWLARTNKCPVCRFEIVRRD